MSGGLKISIGIVIGLLFANLLITGYIGYRLFAMDARQVAASEQLQNLAELAIRDVEDYKQNAYNNTQTDRISEQQLFATETEIALLVKVINGLGLVVWK